MINEKIDQMQNTIFDPESKDLIKDLKFFLKDCEVIKNHAKEVSDLMIQIFNVEVVDVKNNVEALS
jgi:hypothetical protein